jgi:hypothetical protein
LFAFSVFGCSRKQADYDRPKLREFARSVEALFDHILRNEEGIENFQTHVGEKNKDDQMIVWISGSGLAKNRESYVNTLTDLTESLELVEHCIEKTRSFSAVSLIVTEDPKKRKIAFRLSISYAPL